MPIPTTASEIAGAAVSFRALLAACGAAGGLTAFPPVAALGGVVAPEAGVSAVGAVAVPLLPACGGGAGAGLLFGCSGAAGGCGATAGGCVALPALCGWLAGQSVSRTGSRYAWK